MAEHVILYGFPPSTYTQTAALALAEKGVPFEIVPVDIRQDDYRLMHPFQKVPVLVHGDRRLFETLAINIYVDQVFHGPALQPADPFERANMFQWISVFSDYVASGILEGCVRERYVKPMRGQQPDEAFIASRRPLMRRCLETIDGWLSEQDYLSGRSYGIADMFYAPVLFYFHSTPEGIDLLPDRAGVNLWIRRVVERESVRRVCSQTVKLQPAA